MKSKSLLYSHRYESETFLITPIILHIPPTAVYVTMIDVDKEKIKAQQSRTNRSVR